MRDIGSLKVYIWCIPITKAIPNEDEADASETVFILADFWWNFLSFPRKTCF